VKAFVKLVSKRYYLSMMTSNPSAQLITDLLVHLGRRSTATDNACQLTAAQWSALRYFAYANNASRKPSAFAQFHGTTRGTASQTLKSLVKQGLLVRQSNQDDKRSVEFHLTEAGQALLSNDPAMKLFKAVSSLSMERQEVLLDTVQELIDGMADQIGNDEAARFGSCGSCQHYQLYGEAATSSGVCSILNSALISDDEHRICARYQSIALSP